MKKCCRCKRKKPEVEFNFKYKSLGIRQKACRDCTRSEIRVHYNHNKNYYLSKARKRNAILRSQNREFVINYLLRNPCVDCGEADPVVLEFDHIHGKNYAISYIIRTLSIEAVKKEIDKCQVRCANCHRRKTAKERNWYKNSWPL